MKYLLEALVLLAIPLAGVAAAWFGVKQAITWRKVRSAKWKVMIHTDATHIRVQIEKQGEEPIVLRELNRGSENLDYDLMDARSRAESTATTMNLE